MPISLDLEILSTHVDGLTFFKFVGNVSLDVQSLHQNCLATSDGITLACNIPIARSRSTGVNFVTAN